MEEPILISPNKRSEEFTSSNMMSFKDCPNRCIDGYVVDPYTHKRSICPYCEEKRKSFVKNSLTDKKNNKTIEEALNLPLMSSMSGFNFNSSIIIPEFAVKYLKQDSVDNILKIMQCLVDDVTNGIIPDHSILFNLGARSCPNNFIYPYLINAYIAGLSVVPFLNIVDIQNIRKGYTWKEIGEKGKETTVFYDCTFNDIIRRDVFVVKIDAGADKDSVNTVKGVMQLRADNGKPTIIFTEIYNQNLNFLKSEDHMKFYHLATYYTIEQNDKGKKEEGKYLSSSTSPAEISGSDFNALFHH